MHCDIQIYKNIDEVWTDNDFLIAPKLLESVPVGRTPHGWKHRSRL